MIPAPTELQGVDKVTGKSPETRISSGESARALAQRLIKEDEPRNHKRAITKGQVDGNAPYNDAKRKAMGLSWTANLNFMGGKALMDQTGTPYYSIFNGVEHYVEACTAHKPEDPDHHTWNGSIKLRFHEMLKRWTQFDWSMQQASYHMRLHGRGPCFFDRKGNWRFRALPSGAVLAPQGVASCIDERLPFLAIRITYTVVELWDFIRNPDAAGKAGWDVECVKKAIMAAQSGEATGSVAAYDWEKWQQKLKNDDLTTSYTECQDIQCAHLLVREFSGKISHFIVTQDEINAGRNNNGQPEKEKGFLFKDPNAFGDYHQALVVFFQGIGDGTWHSVRGKADDASRHLQVSDRLKNRMVDGAFIESSLIFQPSTQGKADKLQLMQVGPMTIAPPGGELRQTKLAGFLDGPMAVDRMITNHLASNIGASGSRSLSREDGRGEMPTATQIDQQIAKESRIDESDITCFYTNLDRLYNEMFRRAADPATTDEEAKRFQKECEEDGVPKAALRNMKYVRANRASGYGSPQMRQLTDQQMMPVVAMLPEDGKQNFLEDFVGAVKGADKVRRYVPRQHIPNQDDSIAAIENAMVSMGRPPVIAAGQNDVIHLNSHIEDAQKVLEPLAEGMEQGAQLDPAELQSAYQYVQLMAAHVQEHLGRLQGDQARKGQAELFAEEFSYLVAFHGKLRSALRQAQRQAEIAADQEAQATALNALDQAKIDSVRVDTALKQMKTMSNIENSRFKTMNSIRVGNLKTAEQIRAQRALEAARSKPSSKP